VLKYFPDFRVIVRFMSIQRPLPSDSDHRVLKFRPRTLARPPMSAFDGLGRPGPDRTERGRESADDYRHRMITNVLAATFTAALTGIGVWLALTLADLRNAQDCVLMGRRDCAQISAHKVEPVRHF
jgi:hypothetical protein